MPLTPFQEALQKLRSRIPIGADMSSGEWSGLPAALRDRGIWTARMQNARYVQNLKDVAEKILNPVTVMRDGQPVTEGMSVATGKAELREALKSMSYDPGDKAGTIQDLSSDGRIELQLKTNVETVQGYGNFIQGQAPGAIDAFPAQELFRAEDREEPRNWPQRWMQAGGQTFGGRMIALKGDPVWAALGDPNRFPDALGNPYPPFAFNSGMWVRDISRDEAEQLGLIAPGESAQASIEPLNAKLEASVKNLDPELQQSLKESFGDQIVIDGGTAKWRA